MDLSIHLLQVIFFYKIKTSLVELLPAYLFSKKDIYKFINNLKNLEILDLQLLKEVAKTVYI